MKTLSLRSKALLALALSSIPTILSFQTPLRPTKAWKRPTTALSSTSVQSVEGKPRLLTRRGYNVIEEKDPSALTFSGVISKTSRPLVSSRDADVLIDFFKSQRARDTLFVSDAAPIPIQPVPPQLFREWQAETRKLGVSMPTPAQASQQTVMQLCSQGISFSGLTVETTVNCGAKLIDYCPDTGLPAYEFTMINDRTQARGPGPLLYIYNKIMGLVSSSSNQSSSSKTTTSLCRISLVENDKTGDLSLDFESSFQVKAKIPPFLMKILPVSKARAEQQGSAAVSKFVQKGVDDSIQRFEQVFVESLRLAP